MRILSLMSGTSVDGIDIAIADVTGRPLDDGPRLQIEQRHFETAGWDEAVRAAIFALFREPASAALWSEMNVVVADHFADAAQAALHHAGLASTEIDLIASHGQTIWHNVTAGSVTSTLQIGSPAVIAARTGVTTIGNFRLADVAVGGQGAPLVSTFDWLLLRPPAMLNGVAGGWRAVQNIGGIANVTLLPPQDVKASPIAFDTGPGNALIDWAATRVSKGRLRYDRDGCLAAAGKVDPVLLAGWLNEPYFAAPPPKSTGRELFGSEMAQRWWIAAQQRALRPADFVATVTELTAAAVADAYARFSPGPVAQVVVGGGGAANPVLMARLAAQLQRRLGRAVDVITHRELGIDPDAKEALAFALLGYLAIHGWPGNIPSCTGAQRAVVLGEIAPGPNYAHLQKLTAAST